MCRSARSPVSCPAARRTASHDSLGPGRAAGARRRVCAAQGPSAPLVSAGLHFVSADVRAARPFPVSVPASYARPWFFGDLPGPDGPSRHPTERRRRQPEAGARHPHHLLTSSVLRPRLLLAPVPAVGLR
ncbi:hypothetical protein NDU88_007259 [Pleurodeles waltl]|uniref:Uncharacterized protein n=1 Tax=Pleurodeles waltl TaxID=8319 RepID=A0AAV7LS16_PLEWA|nr:hypothetical protein NDU88_007259 [Pleurodeles waltl]